MKTRKIILFVILFAVFIPQIVSAQNILPKVTIGVEESDDPSDLTLSLKIVFLLTILTLAPSILIMMTSFTRLLIVFHFIRASLATQTAPSNQILIGLALFITFFIMKPVFTEVNENAIKPYVNGEIERDAALENAEMPIKAFMLNQTREKDLTLFVDLKGGERPSSVEDISLSTVIPAFIISELKTAFQIGFLLYLPMLMIDIIIASVLLSMGMMMLPPIIISMPFKILLFVLVDGWDLVVESLVKGFM